MKALKPVSAAALALSFLAFPAAAWADLASSPTNQPSAEAAFDAEAPQVVGVYPNRDAMLQATRARLEFIKKQPGRPVLLPGHPIFQGNAQVTTPMLPPEESAKALARYLKTVKAAQESFLHPGFWLGASDAVKPTFGPPPPDGIDLFTLQKSDALEAVYAWRYIYDPKGELNLKKFHAMGTALSLFIDYGVYPPSAAPPGITYVSDDPQEFWIKCLFLGLLWALPLVFASWSLHRIFEAKKKFGVWPHDKHGRRRAYPSAIISAASLSAFLVLIGCASTNWIASLITLGAGCLFACAAAVTGSDSSGFYKTTQLMAEDRERSRQETASMMSSTVQGSARLQGVGDLAAAGFIEGEIEGGPPVF